ncbi:hypothetical protein SUGI_0919050 [Cryptomeria japonica]|nr:hypothetical protein SUGI_0919050 [Cryptomeria japonica]
MLNAKCLGTQISIPAFYIFGDSIADSGNNNFIPNTTALANFPPYGETYFHYPTGRFTNGRTIFDFLASYLGLPFPPPYLQPGADFSHGINFASGGSGLLLSTAKLVNAISLDLQIRQFAKVSSSLADKNGAQAARSFLGGSLFGISIGTNDLAQNFLANATFQKTTTPQDFIKLLLQKYSVYLTTLYYHGARNFLLLDMAPVGCTPSVRLAGLQQWHGQCVGSANQLVQAYNAGFKQLISNMRRSLKGATILTTISYEVVLNTIQNGQASGFSETRSACCGAGPFNAAVSCGKAIPKEKAGEYKEFLCDNPDKYIFWDFIHPTERFYRLSTQNIWNGTSAVIYPFNLRILIHKLNHKQ